MRPKPSRYTGQNVVEFALPALLVGVGVLSVMMNPSWMGVFQNFFAITTRAGIEGRSLVSGSFGHSTVSNAASQYMFPNVPGQQMTLTLSDGSTLKLNFKNPEELVEAMGGDGLSTNALLALDQLIDQLMAQNPDDPKIPILKELAKRGYAIRDAQAQISQMLPPGGFASVEERNAFMESHTTTFDGQELTLKDLAGQLNWYYQKNQNYSENHPELAYNANNNNYFEKYDPTDKANVQNPNALVIQFMDQLDAVRHDPGFGGTDGNTMLNLIDNVLSKTVFLSSAQTIYVPTSADRVELVEKTKISSQDICKFSKFANCAPEENPSSPEGGS